MSDERLELLKDFPLENKNIDSSIEVLPDPLGPWKKLIPGERSNSNSSKHLNLLRDILVNGTLNYIKSGITTYFKLSLLGSVIKQLLSDPKKLTSIISESIVESISWR